MTKRLKGFGVINKPVQCALELPFHFGDSLYFQKATSLHQRKIISYFNDTIGVPLNYRRAYHYDVDGKYLKKSNWMYYVVVFEISVPINDEVISREMFNLNLAFLIYYDRVSLSPIQLIKTKTWFSRFSQDWESYNELNFGRTILSIETEDLYALKTIYEKIKLISISHPNIYYSFKLLSEMPTFRGYNELHSIGLFAVIESLISHNPVSDVDSISRQIKTKMNLLDKRFKNSIDFTFFDNIPHAKIWSLVYAFRSKIAHGGNLEFNGQLKPLKDALAVQTFIEHALKKLLEFSLDEPDLITDLKDC